VAACGGGGSDSGNPALSGGGDNSGFGSPDNPNGSSSSSGGPSGVVGDVGGVTLDAECANSLPDSTSFKNAIEAVKTPSADTPMKAALTGAISYAQQEKNGLTDNGKVVVVLVTDGLPQVTQKGSSCITSSTTDAVNVQAVSDVAAAAAFSTYVVGIGKDATQTGYLNQIAQAGGTGAAITVSTTSADQVTTDLQNALGQIATQQLGCEYGLPAPPDGQAIDVNAVNVDYTPGGGALTTLKYSADCANTNGWHYDALVNPTQIIMCSDVCNTLQTDSGGKVDIVFGCETDSQGDLPIVR